MNVTYLPFKKDDLSTYWYLKYTHQRFYKVPLDADCSNSNVMHNFEAGGWKKLDFIPRNLVKMIGGNVNKGRNESTKTNFSPV